MAPRIALVAVVLAVGLLAFPLVSPPPEPPDRLGHAVYDYRGPDDPDRLQGITVLGYENLSDRGQVLFDAALADRDGQGGAGTHYVSAGEGAPEFTYERSTADYVVERDGTNHRFATRRESPGPDGQDVLLRMGSLLVGVMTGSYGGYRWLNG